MASSSARAAFAYSAAVRYFAKTAGVTLLPPTSVVWAERIVATSSSSGVSKSSSQCAYGYRSWSARYILRARRVRATGVSSVITRARGDTHDTVCRNAVRRSRLPPHGERRQERARVDGVGQGWTGAG